MNGIHYINAGSYKYYNIKITRICYAVFPDKLPQDQRLKMIKAELPLTEDEKIALGFIANTIDDKKKKEDLAKKILLEDEGIKVPRRPYSGLYLYGNFFPKPENKSHVIKVKLVCNELEYIVEGFWKNKYKIGILIPEMYLSPDIIHVLEIKISFDSQVFTSTEHTILHQAAENLPLKFDDYLKLEEEDLKGGKKKKK